MFSRKSKAPSTTTSNSSASSRTTTTSPPQTRSSQPIHAYFPSEHTQLAAGVAIFHIASSRVVLCYHARDRYWFLPKGRKDQGETIEQAACREGFEESGYRNRLLPVPQTHRQPAPAVTALLEEDPPSPFSTEPVWTQLAPNGRNTQYILFWYVAETLPPDVEHAVNERVRRAASRVVEEKDIEGGSPPVYEADAVYAPAEPFPRYQTLSERIEEEDEVYPNGYEPPHHEGTGVDEEEAQYKSFLLPVKDAMDKLAGTSWVMVDVVKRGWEAIELRMTVEQRAAKERAEEKG